MLRAKTIPPTCRWMKSNTVCLKRDNLLVLCACFFAFCYFQAILSSRYWHLTFILASNITKAIITKNTILSCLDHRLMANENALPLSNIIFRKHIFSRYPVLEHRSVFLHLERCEKGFFIGFFMWCNLWKIPSDYHIISNGNMQYVCFYAFFGPERIEYGYPTLPNWIRSILYGKSIFDSEGQFRVLCVSEKEITLYQIPSDISGEKNCIFHVWIYSARGVHNCTSNPIGIHITVLMVITCESTTSISSNYLYDFPLKLRIIINFQNKKFGIPTERFCISHIKFRLFQFSWAHSH